MLWLLFLPVRLTFGLVFALLWLPFVLVRLALKLVGALILAPVVLMLTFVVLLVGGLASALAFLIPVAVFALFVWFLMGLFRPSYGRPF